MKRRLLAQRRSISATKVTVSRHVPMPIRVGAWFLVTMVAAGAAVWIYDSIMVQVQGDVRAALVRSEDLAHEVVQLRAERDALLSSANAADSKIKVEESAREALAKQLKSLESENAKLKADLAFFEGLLPSDAAHGNITIPRLTAERDASGAVLKVRAMVAQGNARSEREFNGRVQVSVITVAAGKTGTMQFPADGMPAADWTLRFKRYQRIELAIPMPTGTQVRSVELRVMDGSTVRARQSTQL